MSDSAAAAEGLDIEAIRREFPAIADRADAPVFFDNPAGTQVPRRVIARMMQALVDDNANLGGYFDTSLRAGANAQEAHKAMADLFNASDWREVVFGQNMTTLTFAISRAIGRDLLPGDEILLTRMDHDANVAPWLMLAEDMGLVVRWIDFDPESFEFDLTQLDSVITDRLRVAAIGYASNVTGTIHDVKTIARAAKSVGALVYVDAVQFAPHGVIDVQEIGCDLLVCSAYKFYGPHHGVLWGRREVLDRLEAYKVRAASNTPPGKFETGTTNRESLAGVRGAIEHFEWIGTTFGGASDQSTRRQRFVAGMHAVDAHERVLTARLIEGLQSFPKLKIQGLTEKQTLARRVPTVSFTYAGTDPAEICKAMAARNISLWHGHNYGIEPTTRLGLIDKGGVVRVGLAQYNTTEEVDRFISSFGEWTTVAG
ncbi:cysteine desulfurase-like protein [Kaistia granuli]|uniref:cysteine desulfurase-like protein n=1 Tax=Kaistia granuli TaxID=363259 RepID=UPI00035C8412|nr:cysteine desulfurase-like protein [Kaistia granuli]